jgi:hypothetical protein
MHGLINKTMAFLPLVTRVNSDIMVVHGCIPTNEEDTLDRIQKIDRFFQLPVDWHDDAEYAIAQVQYVFFDMAHQRLFKFGDVNVVQSYVPFLLAEQQLFSSCRWTRQRSCQNQCCTRSCVRV